MFVVEITYLVQQRFDIFYYYILFLPKLTGHSK